MRTLAASFVRSALVALACACFGLEQHVQAQCFPEWKTLGFGFDNGVLDFASFDAGSGEQLYACGNFTTVGGLAQAHFARWNGAFWEALPTTDAQIRELATHDDGSGTKLYAGGSFTLAGGLLVNHVAAFDGNSWGFVGGGMDSTVRTLLSVPSGPPA